MTRPQPKLGLRCLLVAALWLTTFAAMSSPLLGRASIHREVSRSLPGIGPSQPIGTGVSHRSWDALSKGSTPTGVQASLKTTVDSRRHTGYENAVYSPDGHTVFVAYKRFLRDPTDPGGDYVEARLRVARSTDGGKNWTIQVVDPQASEAGDLIDQSVAIGGDRGSTIYVTYLIQTGGGAKAGSLRIAKSSDGGETWTIRTVAGQNIGGYVALKVLDSKKVLVAAKKAGGTEPLRLHASDNSGRTWSRSRIDTFGWYTGLDASGSGRIWAGYYNPGATSLHAASSMQPDGPWTRHEVAGQGGDEDYTGLGNSLDVSRSGDVYLSYEDFQPQRGRSVLRVSKSTDGGSTWTRSRADAAPILGWNTAIHVLSNPPPAQTHAFVAYWYGRLGDELKGQVRLAYSDDEAETWSISTVRDRHYVFPYLDLTVPESGVQYVSYQARTEAGETILRVARLNVTR